MNDTPTAVTAAIESAAVAVTGLEAQIIAIPGTGQIDFSPTPPTPAVETTAVEQILTDRGTRYGKFKDTAQVAQELKRVLTRHAHAIEASFSDSQWEALEMICHKTARIVNGDPNYIDSWIDIAGYAQLIADELRGIDR